MKKFVSKRLCAILVLIAILTSFVCPFAVSAEGSFKVIFDANGGICETESLTTKVDGTLDVLPSATCTGYIFDGWYTEPEGGSYVFSAYVFEMDTTIFAHWKYKSDPVIKSPAENQVVHAKVGDTVEFSVDVEFADEIKWYLNKNDGGDITLVEEDYFTTVTIENIPESYEGYVYYCEVRNENTPEDAVPIMSPSFTIDLEGVDKSYDLPEPETVKDGLSDWVVILIVFVGIAVLSVVAAIIVAKIDNSKNKKNRKNKR